MDKTKELEPCAQYSDNPVQPASAPPSFEQATSIGYNDPSSSSGTMPSYKYPQPGYPQQPSSFEHGADNIPQPTTNTPLLQPYQHQQPMNVVYVPPYGGMGIEPGMVCMQPDMGMQHGMVGMQPGMGMQQGMVGMQPGMGMQQGMVGMHPGMGMHQGMGMQPSMGIQPGMQPGMVSMHPYMGMQPQPTVTMVTGGGMAPVAFVSRPYYYNRVAKSFLAPTLLAMFVFMCCGVVFGFIAFVLATLGSRNAHLNETDLAARLKKASYGMSIAGIIIGITVIIVIIIIIILK